MLITPRISEKSYRLAANGTYVFDVPLSANKAEVIKSVESQYGVKVADVRLLIAKGKVKRVNRGKFARPGATKLSDKKRAYVSLKEGKIDVFTEAAGEEA